MTEEDTESSSEFGDDSSEGDESGGGSHSGGSHRPGIDLDIGATLKRLLEQDHDLITRKNKVCLVKC